MSADLVTWLRACIDDDQRVAKSAVTEPFPVGKGLGAGVWRQGAPAGHMWAERIEGDDLTIYDEGGHSEAHAAHIARWDPARVLAEVAAKRAILDEHAIIHRDIGWLEEDDGERVENYAELPVCVRCVPKHSHFPRREDVPVGPCRTVRLCVAPFVGRSGFNPSWLD